MSRPPRSRARGRDQFRRRPGNKPGRRVLIVCEGKNTEPGYLRALLREFRLGGVTIKGGYAPSGAVAKAIALQRQARREGAPYDAIWCAFDRDPEHTDFECAIAEARKNEFGLAVSVPSFEYWLLLHYKVTARQFFSGDELIAELCKCCPSFDKKSKTADWASVIANRAVAAENAIRVVEQSWDRGEYPHPSTTVHELVAFLARLAGLV